MEDFIDEVDELVIGTNEEYVLGYYINFKEDGTASFSSTFHEHAHTGRVKQLAVSGNYLVSGSSDEYIKIFDLRTRHEIGSISPHSGTITGLKFHQSGNQRFLFSCSEDGDICIISGKLWETKKKLKGHSAAVTSMAIHTSGKLALSGGKDKLLITWNLISGARAVKVHLKYIPNGIWWSPDGSHYLISSLDSVYVYSVETGKTKYIIKFGDNVHCLLFLTDNLFIVGGEKKDLSVYNLIEGEQVCTWEAHENRCKAVVKLNAPAVEDEDGDLRFAASASSDGTIKIWLFHISDINSGPKLIGKENTKCRLICMSVALSSSQPTHSEVDLLSTEMKSEIPVSKALKISDAKLLTGRSDLQRALDIIERNRRTLETTTSSTGVNKPKKSKLKKVDQSSNDCRKDLKRLKKNKKFKSKNSSVKKN